MLVIARKIVVDNAAMRWDANVTDIMIPRNGPSSMMHATKQTCQQIRLDDSHCEVVWCITSLLRYALILGLLVLRRWVSHVSATPLANTALAELAISGNLVVPLDPRRKADFEHPLVTRMSLRMHD